MGLDIQTVVSHKTKKKQTVAWSTSKTGYYIWEKGKGFALYPRIKKDDDATPKTVAIKVKDAFPNYEVLSTGRVDNFPDLRSKVVWSSDYAKQADSSLSDEDASNHESPAMWKLIGAENLMPTSPEPSVEGCRCDVGVKSGKEKHDVAIWEKMVEVHKKNAGVKKDGTFVATADSCLEAVIRETGYYHSNSKAIIASKTRIKKLLAARLEAHKVGDTNRWESLYPKVTIFQRTKSGSTASRSKVPKLTVDDIEATLQRIASVMGMKVMKDGVVPK